MQQNSSSTESILDAHLPQLRSLAFRDALRNDQLTPVVSQLIAPQSMLVLLCFPYDYPHASPDALKNALHLLSHLTEDVETVHLGDYLALVLKGDVNIARFHQLCIQHQDYDPAADYAHPGLQAYFVTVGRVVHTADQLHLSYRDAWQLYEQRFFHHRTRHILMHENFVPRTDRPNVITARLLEEYTDRLLQSIQAHNRSLTSAALQQLQDILAGSGNTAEEIRFFLADLYLQIKEQMKYLYQGYTIPFYSNTHILRTVWQATHLNDIMVFLAQRFDMLMSSIGESSRESVLDDILHYIQHNYHSNLTLENIAPLFGYNHSYLGKIFRKKMNISFNEYLDRLRIERAKELLRTTDNKVYMISERVGYKNVDYFHVKFRKYVSISPAEFRKINQIASHSPSRENVEKGPLFP